MSSMFKKKGGLAFKPKIPSSRARPAASGLPPAPPPAKPPPSQPPIDSQPQPIPEEIKEATTAVVPLDSSAAVKPQESRNLNHPSPTPPNPILELAKPDDTTPAHNTSSEKPQEPNNVHTEAIAEKKIAVDVPERESEAALKSAPTTVPEQAQPAQEVNAVDDSHQNQPVIPTPAEVSTPASQAIDEAATTDSAPSITPTESVETTPQPFKEGRKKPAPKPRTRKQAAKTAQEETGEEDESARPKKRQRKVTKEGADAAPKLPRQPRKRKATTQTDGEGQTRSRRARSITPEDSENQVVDLQQLKMADLTKDLHIGKKFSRHDELRERERRSRLKTKIDVASSGERDSSATPDGTGPRPKNGSPVATSAPAPASGPQFRIVDGQIVVDQSSLAVDRHARAAAALGDMETVEENDFTRLITSNSFMNTSKLKGPNIWTEPETELFYRGLRMFGTDFEMISKMFPGKQRRHVKLKYNREERHCPRRIDSALIGEKTIKMDLDEYKAFTGAEFESVESIEAEQRKIQEDFEAEQQRVADEQAEIMRKKREELFADDEDDTTKKRKSKKGKQKVIYGLNGEPIST